MELLQKIDINTADNGSKRLDAQVRNKTSSELDSAQSKPFKEQLSEQSEQLNSQMNSKKQALNQQDNEVQSVESENVGKDLDATRDAGDEIVSSNIEDSILQANAVLKESAPELDAIELNQPKVAAGVIETGNILPVNETLVDNIAAQKSVAASIGVTTRAASVGIASASNVASTDSQAKSVETDIQNANKSATKVALNLSGLEMRGASSELAQQKPVTFAPSLSANLLEKASLQDAKFTKMSSEFSSADVISQASKLQQVPVTTAVSSSVSALQNMAVNLISETPNSLSQPTPLTNAPLNTLSAAITTNLSNQNWSQQMTQQVAYMVKGGVQQAEVKLNPAHLGPMEIKLSIKDDQATINFVTQHAPVRDAIDSAMPRLKEMLEQQGLNLADANVSTQSEQHQANSEKQQNNNDDTPKILSGTESENNEVKQIASITVDSGVSIFA